MLKLFKRKTEEKESKEKQIVMVDQTSTLEESISLLTKEDKDSVEEVIEEVEETVKEATRSSLKDLKLLEEGRCAQCGKKAKQFLFTTVCENCGWTSFITPEKSRQVVHLTDGGRVECENTFRTKTDEVLCITDQVVWARVPNERVSFIEYPWTDEEIAERREQRKREEMTLCSWCNKEFRWGEEEGAQVTYAAFGNFQDKYPFCTEKCRRSFQKQYPVRIHRNCYERPCEGCNECIKKYENTSDKVYGGFSRL